jgi:hypothetical protein
LRFCGGSQESIQKEGWVAEKDCELLVHLASARKFPFRMFKEMVARAWADARPENFTHVHVLDDKEGCYLQVR